MNKFNGVNKKLLILLLLSILAIVASVMLNYGHMDMAPLDSQFEEEPTIT